MATSLQAVKLDKKDATKIVKYAKSNSIYSDNVPKTEKELNDAVNEIIAFCVDAWVNMNVRPDDEDEDSAAAAAQVEEILAMAGMEIDDDNNISYGDSEDDEEDDEDDEEDEEDEEDWDEESLAELKTPNLKEIAESFDVDVPDGKIGSKRKAEMIAAILEAQEGDEDEDEDEDDDEEESPFDIDDLIDGYDELTPASKTKAIKKLKLDPEDEDEAEVLDSIREHESEQDKPSTRVMDWITEQIGEPEEQDDEDEEDEDEVDDEDEESDEPFEGYDDASIKEIKEALAEAAEEEDEEDRLTAEDIESIVEYEKENENRKTFIKWLENDLVEMLEEEEDEDEEEDEPTPKRKGRKSKKNDPDEEDDVDNAVAKDDDEFVERVATAVLARIAEMITAE